MNTKRFVLWTLFLITVFIVPAYGSEMITAQEIDCYRYADGKIENLKEYMEITLEIDGDKVRKTRVYNIKRKTEIPDRTEYSIQRRPPTDLLDKGFKGTNPVIKAVGEPGFDSIEILVIGEKYIQSVKSEGDTFIISRFQIIK